MRIDERVQATVLVALAAYGLLVSAPLILGGRVVEPFSELGVLGPNLKLGDYPREVAVGESFNLYLYLGNHEGEVSYYRILLKVGDQGLNVSDVEPYGGVLIGSIEHILQNGGNATIPLIVRMPDLGLNRRLVFELQRYDPALGGFRYEGVWTQLWLNVTGGA
jgi:uncharacterized membrane protein